MNITNDVHLEDKHMHEQEMDEGLNDVPNDVNLPHHDTYDTTFDAQFMGELSMIVPGPSDPSVLTMGDCHRSSRAWTDSHVDVLYCRGGSQSVHKRIGANPRIVDWIRDAGFYGIYQIGHIQLDWHLVAALVERWMPETHTFHLPHREATITLQDVAVLFGLPIDGLLVIGRTAGPV
ncbi:serine/threonine-protein phosphatase 7 long form homolog [Malania oleifera]|uniref:serine/threonine-protein phosphatase 7 long form homolog n=1 Tax=Malania oleifera TaxID=397392 RepID=UPI0025ADB1E9|nr:serine/threonine-protein phosphatase 7 long form homolog [Malania oleifera]